MKNLYLLLGLLIVQTALGQIQPVQRQNNAGGFLKTNNGVIIKDKAYTIATLDTTETLDCLSHKTLFVSIQSKDSAAFLIRYQLSLDGSNWGALTTKDSLTTISNTGDVKSLDLSSTILGAQYVRFVFDYSVATPGTSSATYSASYLWKKE